MKIASSTEEGVATLALDGRFDAHEVTGFRAAVEKEVRPGAVVRLDLGSVRFIDSTALAELLRLRKALLGNDGRLLLTPLSDPVRVILELTGLDAVLLADEPARAAP